MTAPRGARTVAAFPAAARLGACLALLLLAARVSSQDIAVRGELVHTMAGDPIANGVVVIRGGKIAAVGPAASTPIPEGFEVLSASVVVPGLIDAHATVGLTGWLNQDDDQDHFDASAALQPELRAVDAYNARDPLVGWLASLGVTTVHTGHSPSAVISGQSFIAKTRGGTVADAVLVPAAMVCATLGEQAATGEGKAPGSRSRAAAMLRQALLDAQAYADKRGNDDESKRPDRNLRHEAMARVLSGELPLLVTAHHHQDISTALRLAEEFGFRLVLDGAAEAHQLLPEIKAAGVPVIPHPAMVRAWGATSPFANASMELPHLLLEAGIPMAQQSGFEDYVPKVRVVLLEAAVAGRWGLTFEQNLASITREAAELLGISDKVGTLEVGKHGDLALYDGDPFEYVTHCVGTVIEGEVVSDIVR
ncbi:MAG: amidohydrolase [Planctomycetota bacterium]|nr:MAG: amidohydrolase [Planctomycetota bacterium]